jgi:hypothetical protein
MDEALRKAVWKMANSNLRNYIAPGLTSYLVGGPDAGKVRLFHSDRNTREWITPHSHRFDFTCLVLKGRVTNILLRPLWGNEGDLYAAGKLKRAGKFGEYEFTPGTEVLAYAEERSEYSEGDVYSMTHAQIHSIQFARGTEVLFFEGPEVTDESVVLEPWSNGKRIPTFVTQPWMFERESPEPQPESRDP